MPKLSTVIRTSLPESVPSLFPALAQISYSIDPSDAIINFRSFASHSSTKLPPEAGAVSPSKVILQFQSVALSSCSRSRCQPSIRKAISAVSPSMTVCSTEIVTPFAVELTVWELSDRPLCSAISFSSSVAGSRCSIPRDQCV